MQATVIVQQDVAQSLQHQRPPSAASNALLRLIEECGAVLEPLHPGTSDPQLASYFLLRTPQPSTGEEVITRLRDLEVVEAAYVKPQDELP